MRVMRRWLSIALVVLTFGFVPGVGATDVGLIKIDGAIGPATVNYISRAVESQAR